MRCDAHTLTQVTRQFGEMDPECAAKQKFAAWRAAEVRSALKQGRAPTPLAQKVDEFPLDDKYDRCPAVVEPWSVR
jgi:vacuolar protein sorting-associated protein VTA1